MCFCFLRRNSRWLPKMVTNFHQNRSISNRFQDKYVFALYAEIQDCKMSPVHSADTLQIHNFVEIALSCTVSEINALYTEIQDGCQKWRESDFLRKVASRLRRYPVGPNFRRNRSISHHFQDKCAFVFYIEIQDGH